MGLVVPLHVGPEQVLRCTTLIDHTAAIACNLASGMNMISAVRKANLYIEAGIKTSSDIGKGSGPINHFHSTYTLPFSP
jgi:hypothetical protein